MANKKPFIEITRGTGSTIYFRIPTNAFVPGVIIYFTAKPAVDNDITDSLAVIKKAVSDADIVPITNSMYVAGKVTYAVTFTPLDTKNIKFIDGADENDYLGQFEYVAPGQAPVSYPYKKFIKTTIFADIKVENN